MKWVLYLRITPPHEVSAFCRTVLFFFYKVKDSQLCIYTVMLFVANIRWAVYEPSIHCMRSDV